MRRREFIALVGGAVLAGPRSVSAQPTERSYRVGWISVTHGFAQPYVLAFVQRQEELGFVEGRNHHPLEAAAAETDRHRQLPPDLVT